MVRLKVMLVVYITGMLVVYVGSHSHCSRYNELCDLIINCRAKQDLDENEQKR